MWKVMPNEVEYVALQISFEGIDGWVKPKKSGGQRQRVFVDILRKCHKGAWEPVMMSDMLNEWWGMGKGDNDRRIWLSGD